ncbi:MAG: type III pantothenate kinase [Candidatus Gastranaerophilales bacterium]|nr:type III pantothenate kinase [Candidatus Gastranaerophilales bacterium]
MLLAIDAGNTSISFGVFDGKELIQKFNLASDKKRSVDEYGVLITSILQQNNIDKNVIEDVILASVVPTLTDTLKYAIKNYLDKDIIKVNTKINTGLTYKLDNPKELGADRIANARAAVEIAKNKPSIVVDFGTATNFDVVSKNKEFLGGAIAAGINISALALSNYTSLLPKIRVEEPPQTIGKNTIDCILSGIIIGHAKMIDGMIENIEKELGEKAIIIATGGYNDIVKHSMKREFDFIEPDLTLTGLRLIYESL